MSRKSKIAGLPRDIREELNQRIDDGQQGTDLAVWLNSLDEVQETLRCEFDGHPINEQNISTWKQGAFRHWQRRQELRESIGGFVDLSEDVDEDGGMGGLPDRLAAAFAVELVAETKRLAEASTDPKERCRHLSEALKQLQLLRQARHDSARARVEEARWEKEIEDQNEEKKAQARSKLLDLMMEPIRTKQRRATLIRAHGGGVPGEKTADFIIDAEKKYSEAKLFTEPLSHPIDPNSPCNPGDPEELYFKYLLTRARGID